MTNQFLTSQLDDSASDSQILDARLVLRWLYRHKWGILVLTLIGAIFGAYYANTLPYIFQAKATVLIKDEKANVVSIQDVYNAGNGYDWSYKETQYGILRSRSIAEGVVRQLKLNEDPAYRKRFFPAAPVQPAVDEASFSLKSLVPAGFNSPPPKPPAPETPEEREAKLISNITGYISGGISVYAIPDSYLVNISFKSEDPKEAAKIVNAVSDQYITSQLEARVSATQKATSWLNERLGGLRENLKQSEERLQRYREQEQLVDLKGVSTLSAQELSSATEKYAEARQRRLVAENVRQEIIRLKESGLESYLSIPAIQQKGNVQQLQIVESTAARKVEELGKRYGPKHPKMIAAQSDLDTARKQLRAELEKVVDGIETDYVLAKRAEDDFAKQLNLSKRQVQNINRKEFEIQELEREVETNRQLYDMFFSRLKETDTGSSFEQVNARVIDYALVPTGPISPNKQKYIVMAAFLGFAFGAGLAVLHGMLDNTLKTPDDVQEKLRQPLLGALPEVKTDKDGAFEQYWQKHQNSFGESVRSIRTGLVLSSLDKPAKLIVITSSVPGEGKSTTSLNLGAAFAHLGEKTLVIGADLRRPSLAKKCGVPPNHPGLSNLVAGDATIDECLTPLGDEGMQVIAAGLIPSNPLEMLSSHKFKEVLEDLKTRFDRIIVDSAPIQAVSDALILGSYADAMVYLVKADSTSSSVAKKGIDQILASNQPLVGVILNRFNYSKASKYYGYGKYYRYGDYYQSASS